MNPLISCSKATISTSETTRLFGVGLERCIKHAIRSLHRQLSQDDRFSIGAREESKFGCLVWIMDRGVPGGGNSFC